MNQQNTAASERFVIDVLESSEIRLMEVSQQTEGSLPQSTIRSHDVDEPLLSFFFSYVAFL